MKKSKLFGLFMIAVLMVGLVLAGCGNSKTSANSSNSGSGGKSSGGGSGSGGKITLTFANWVSEETATKKDVMKVIAAFERKHPNVTIKNIPIPFDNMRQQLMTMVAGGNSPDVMMLSGPWTQELGAKRALVDLSTLASKSYINDNYKGGLDAGKYNGKLYSVPVELTPHGFWYNKDLMKKAGLDPNKPPKTMNQLNADIKQIKNKLGGQGIYPIALDTTKIDYALVEFWPWFYNHGAYPLYNGKVNFNTPQVQSALKWLRNAAQKKYTPVGQQIKVERELMAKDKVVFKLDGPYLKGILRSLNPKLKGQAFYNKFGVTTVPTGANSQPETLADIHQLGISSQSKNKKMAWEFVKFLAHSKTSIKQYIIPVGSIPPLKSDEKTYSNLLKDPVSKAYTQNILKTMKGGPYGPNYGDASQTIIQAMQEAVNQKTPISQITKQTQQKLKQIYGK